jgi:hypothetical protein
VSSRKTAGTPWRQALEKGYPKSEDDLNLACKAERRLSELILGILSQVDSDLADQINFSSELDIFHSGRIPH